MTHDPYFTELAAADAAARERALDPHASILLQAPAGSGKTTVLTQRFLRLLAEVAEPEEILAITFTRKAAGEMRDRVFKALRGEIAGTSAQAEQTRELARRAMAQSRALGWSLETHPGRLRIQTIDSLNRWLASRLPIAARAAGDLAILERPLALYRLAARRALLDAESDEALLPHVERLFDRLDNDFSRFERLLTGMLQARSHWLPHVVEANDDELRQRVEASLKAIVDERLASAAAIFPQELIASGARIARQGALNRQAEGVSKPGPWQVWLAARGEEFPDELGIPHVESAPQDRSPLKPPLWRASPQGTMLSLRHWQGLCQLALTEGDTWRSVLTKRNGFPTTDPALKAVALRWIADLQSIRGAHEMLVELASLPYPTLGRDDALALGSLARVLKLAAAELEVVFQEAARVDYPYIAAAARRALADRGSPTDLALRLGAEVRHVLVDEFQDTSIEQYGLLESLTAGWDAGDGRTLFMVGDPMQSIYQFREAEVGLFLRTRERGLGSVRLAPLTLTRNFRSAPHLVAWTNNVFPSVFPAFDDPRSGAVRYLASVPGRDETVAGQVELHRTPASDSSAESRTIAALIARMRALEPQASIAILVAARSHAVPIIAALQAERIPVAGVDLVSLAELAVIRDLTALTRALDHLGDRTAWLAILRAPWCGLTLRDLTLLVGDAPLATVWECMHDAARVARLSKDSAARLARAQAVLSGAQTDRDRRELPHWVETTWLRLGGPAVCSSDEDLEHANAFFNALARWSSEPDWAGPLSLDERLSELYAVHSGAPADAVQIMTIHRAKGLEFDKVIVPGLGRRMRGDPEPLLRWLELPREPDGSDLLMAAIPETARRGMEPLNEYLKSLQTRRVAHERARLLYVAATRARTELHLFGELAESSEGKEPRVDEEAKPASSTLLATLWPAIGSVFPKAFAHDGGVVKAPDGSRGAPSASQLAPDLGRHSDRNFVSAESPGVNQPAFERLKIDWHMPPIARGPKSAAIPIASYEAEEEEDPLWATDPDRCVAHVVRQHLCAFARRGSLPQIELLADLEMMLRERLSRIGLTDADLESCALRTDQIMVACLADSRLRWMFSQANGQSVGPLRLTGLYEGRLTSIRVDYSFVDKENQRWLIDFALVTSKADEDVGVFVTSELARLRPLLEKNRMLAQHLGSEPVRVAVYFPFAQIFAEHR